MKKKIFVHLGFPKTATTTLQKKIFPSFENFCCYGPDFNEKLVQIFDKVALLNKKKFDKEKIILLKLLKSEFRNSPKNIILSFEGWLHVISYHTKKNPNKYKIYRTLHRLFFFLNKLGEVKFLFVIRRHKNILESFFSQFQHSFMFHLQEEDIYNLLVLNKKKYQFIFDSYNYGKLYLFLKKISKKNEMLIYEDLIFNKKLFINKLALFFDQKKIDSKLFLNIMNSRQKKYYYFDYLLDRLIKLKLPDIKNIWKYKFKISKYKEELILLKNIFFPKKIRLINLEKYEKDIKKYYKNDLEKFPIKIKKELKKYNYF